jgi:hypothetical protein
MMKMDDCLEEAVGRHPVGSLTWDRLSLSDGTLARPRDVAAFLKHTLFVGLFVAPV